MFSIPLFLRPRGGVQLLTFTCSQCFRIGDGKCSAACHESHRKVLLQVHSVAVQFIIEQRADMSIKMHGALL